MTEPRDAPSHALWAAVLVLLAYAVLPSWVGEYFPLNRFDLFAFSEPRDSRLIVVDSDNQLTEVWGWSEWACESPRAQSEAPSEACISAIIDPIRDEQVRRHIRRNPLRSGARAQSVRVMRQLISIEAGQPPELELCHVKRCRAVRRE